MQDDGLGATADEVADSLREDVKLAFKLCNEHQKTIAHLEARLRELEWVPIDEAHLPNVGDEMLRNRRGVSGEPWLAVESMISDDEWTAVDWINYKYTHYRPINAPSTAPAQEDVMSAEVIPGCQCYVTHNLNTGRDESTLSRACPVHQREAETFYEELDRKCAENSARADTNVNQKGYAMKIDELTIGEAKQLAAIFSAPTTQSKPHPMLGRRCLIRTYSAGIHIGDVVYIDGMEVKLENALRLWKWEGGGLSLSVVASRGIKGGRLNETGEIYLTNVIEIIPTTAAAEATYVKFIEDKN